MNWTSRTLGGVLDEVARARAEHRAVVYADQQWSYGRLAVEADLVARALLGAGVRPGDRVAGLISNRPEWLAVCFAAAKVGATFVPLNTWYKQDELRWTLNHTEAAVLISETQFLKRDYSADLRAIDAGVELGEPGQLRLEQLPYLRTVVYLNGERPGAFDWPGFLALGEAVDAARLARVQAAVDPDDPFLILYTSGSTADPKGVVLRHRGIVENGYGIGSRRDLDEDDVIWLGSPLFYGLGAANCLPAWLTHGATLALQGHFTSGSALDVIERERCTVFYGMSNMIRKIFEDPGYAPERVASLTKGTAGISEAERRLLIEKMGVCGATQSYGATELYGNCFGGSPDDELDVKLITCGTPLPGFECRVVDPESLEPLPDGAVGLLLVRGYTAGEYFRNPGESARAFLPDGFYNTGDLGSFDAAGRFRFHTREKEMLKVGGINVSPIEVEQLLLRHPDVSEASVVGIPDPLSTEAIVAVVSVTGGLSPEELKLYVAAKAASFKTPRHILVRPPEWVPRTGSGKVAKAALRSQVLVELT
jgi:fatty-acyl-CoA synthase